MRNLTCPLFLLFLGCGSAEPTVPTIPTNIPLLKLQARGISERKERPSQTQQISYEAAAQRDDALPKDLRTRRGGSDWPGFLGPTGDSVSTEKGILSPWPNTGPPLVWHRRLGEGYGMPAISRGRLFIFDRVGDRARLSCWKSETGEPLWTFDYPTDYQDL